MNLRPLLLSTLLLASAGTSFSQLTESRVYGLLTGSQLTDDCPVCDRLPIIVPIAGTFVLQRVSENPLFTSFEVRDVSFQTTDPLGPQYRATGSGTYRFGGEVALIQEMSLDLKISNGLVKTDALLVSGIQVVTQSWTTIQISLHQTNGTITQVYYLDLIAAPLPQFTSITADPKTGDVRLTWEGVGGKFQVERAGDVVGPFLPVGPPTSELSFTDVGATTNHTRLFYRLKRP